jgi:hypothetical protein
MALRKIFLYDAEHVMEAGEKWTRGSFIICTHQMSLWPTNKGEMGRTCGTHGTMINAYSNIEVSTRCTCHRVYFI